MGSDGTSVLQLGESEEPGRSYLGDKWLASSALQKALRRGHASIAKQASRALLALDKGMLWRRLQCTIVEDVAPLDVPAIAQLLSARLIPSQLDLLIEILCDAPKDRSTDYLLAIMQYAPELAKVRYELGVADGQTIVRVALDENADLPTRCLAAWYCGGTVAVRGANLLQRYGSHSDLYAAFARRGDAQALLDGCDRSLRLLRNALPLIYPQVANALAAASFKIEESALPPPVLAEGIPVYAAGGHTRLGKVAIGVWIDRNHNLRRALSKMVDARLVKKAAELAVFFVESAVTSKDVRWAIGDELKGRGVRADFQAIDADVSLIGEALHSASEHLPDLDTIRAALIAHRARVLAHGGLSYV